MSPRTDAHTSEGAPASPDETRSRALTEVIARGQALERLGHPDQARECYERALHDGGATSAADAAQLVRLVARTYLHDFDYEAVADCANAAYAISDQADDEAGRGHATNYLAIIAWKQGDLDEAQRLYLKARRSAHKAGELRLAAMTASNLGIIATVRGEDAEALSYYGSSLADARRAELPEQMMHALINLGLLHTHRRNYVGADRDLMEARVLAEQLGDLGHITLIDLHVAKLRVLEGRYAEASESCDRARSAATEAGDTHADGEAEHVAGLIARAEGDTVRAESHFLRAEEIAVKRSDLILQGETARDLAGLYRELGQNRNTLIRLNQAHRLFAQLRAQRELADVDRRTARLESDFLEVVRKWGDTIESKDNYTQGHCIRVANLACALWNRVESTDTTTLFWFRIGALLHDVGKLIVPATLLNKPGKLSEEEWDLIRGHPAAGVELLADIEFPWDVRPIVESHHERWDGKGYPHRLVGNAIPLTARILCIADVYDALTSRRSYKEPFSHQDAMAVMRRDAGTAFDPALFEQFELLVREGAWEPPTDLEPDLRIA